MTRGPRCRVCLIAPAVRDARRASWSPSERRGSVPGQVCHEHRGCSVSRRTATSGPAPATCCTWTPASTAASTQPGHRVTGDRSSQDAGTTTVSTSCMRSSTTNRDSPTRDPRGRKGDDGRRLSRPRPPLLRPARLAQPTSCMPDPHRGDARPLCPTLRLSRPHAWSLGQEPGDSLSNVERPCLVLCALVARASLARNAGAPSTTGARRQFWFAQGASAVSGTSRRSGFAGWRRRRAARCRRESDRGRRRSGPCCTSPSSRSRRGA
jgi:hypothetical protein